MPMLITLNVPEKHARWATGASRTIEPDENGPDIPNKDDGWINNYRPPARVQNWINNLNYKWNQIANGAIISNFWPNAEIAGPDNDIDDVIFHPVHGKFLMIIRSNDDFYSSVDGHTWSIPQTIAVTKRSTGIDLTRYLVGASNGYIYYSSDPALVTWTAVSDATIGGSGTVFQIHTRYPDDNYCIIVKGSGIRIASTGILGSWSAPTTPPTVSTTFNSLVYAGNSTWYLSTGTNPSAPTIYQSDDDGDTWSQIATQPYSSSSDKNGGIAYSRDSNRLIACANISPSFADTIKYSDNGGASWNTATIDKSGLTSLLSIEKVYYCGGDMWIAIGGNIDGDTGEKAIYVSKDNGENWKIPDINQAAKSLGTTSLRSVCCSKRNVVAVGDNGINITSLSF